MSSVIVPPTQSQLSQTSSTTIHSGHHHGGHKGSQTASAPSQTTPKLSATDETLASAGLDTTA